MNPRGLLVGVVLGLFGGHGAAYAAPPSIDNWQMKRLFKPTPAQLASEAKGRVMIYDGMTDKTVHKALEKEFDRIDAMMFTSVVVTDDSGAARRSEESGEVQYEDDGCQ